MFSRLHLNLKCGLESWVRGDLRLYRGGGVWIYYLITPTLIMDALLNYSLRINVLCKNYRLAALVRKKLIKDTNNQSYISKLKAKSLM